jgi:RNA polymerase sigma factor (sigma-70 family)
MIAPALPTPPDESTTAWALAARSGDAEAVEHFVRALHRDVRRYVTSLGADPQSADDLTQDTFLRALGSLHRFEGRSSARTWLLTIARRAVVDNLRYAARPRLSDTDDWQSAAERCPAARPARIRRGHRARRPAGRPARRAPRGFRPHPVTGPALCRSGACQQLPRGDGTFPSGTRPHLPDRVAERRRAPHADGRRGLTADTTATRRSTELEGHEGPDR